MPLSPENSAIFERSLERAARLVELDPELRNSMPSLETFREVIDCRTSIEIVQKVMETYAERPAVGRRRYEVSVDEKSGKRTAQFLPAFETLSYRGLWERVVLLSGGLKHRGLLASGDIATLIGFSTVDHLVAELACHYLAVTSVPLAKNVGARELEQIVNACESKTLFCTLEHLSRVARSLENCRSIKTLVVIDFIRADDTHLETVAGARTALRSSRPDLEVATIGDLETFGAKSPKVAPEIPAEGSDPLLSLVYTSGSTGAPKGAMLHEKSWHARWSTLPFLELAALPMVSVVFLPQNHMGGRNAVANSLKLGGVAHFTRESDMSTLFEDIRIVRPTYIHLVPRLSEMIYKSQDVSLGDRLLLALSASAPTPPEVSAFIKKRFEIPVVDVFAGTEYGQLFVDGSVNRHNVLELKLVSVPELGYLETDQPYPRGELYVKTARAISSYFRNEKATSELFDASGFIRTGDIFEQRGPDQMAWIDRKNNVLKLAQGEFVNIWKLEALYTSGSRLIKQIYIQGDSTRSYLLAVLVPEREETSREMLRAELNRLADAHGLQSYERLRDFLVEPEPFSRDSGLLTSLNKPARPKLRLKYGAAIDRLYEELDRRAASGSSNEKNLPPAARARHLIAGILGLPEASLDLSQQFKSLGGDSIAAANLCASIEKELGVRLSVGFVLGPKTLLSDIAHEVAARIEQRTPTAFEKIHGPDPQVIEEKHLRLERFFHVDAAVARTEGPASNYLLTGATGFLGRFLCLELLERAAKIGGKIHCLVRGSSGADATRRLAETYRRGSLLHERFAALAREHLEVHAGDLEKERFGLPTVTHRRLTKEVDTVIHAAALVNHALPYSQLFEANVLSTAEVMRFALEGRRKNFNFISTNSVSLALLGERSIALETDDTRTLGDRWPTAADRHAGGYQLSKWAGEVLAQDLFETFGVPVNIFRCNLILPPARFRDQINTGDFLTRLICSVVYTKLCPRSFYDGPKPHIDGFPVDFIAAGIAAIVATTSHEFRVYHVNNVHFDDGVSLDTVTTRLSALGYSLSRIDNHATWFRSFQNTLEKLDPAQRAASSLPIIEQWKNPLSTEKRQRIDASSFRAKIRTLRPHGFEDIPQLSDDYFDRCIEDIRRRGLIGR